MPPLTELEESRQRQSINIALLTERETPIPGFQTRFERERQQGGNIPSRSCDYHHERGQESREDKARMTFMQEKKDTTWFGLIVGEEVADAFLHGYEVTMDGDVVVPELRPKSPRQ
jgi:hypothetical protein